MKVLLRILTCVTLIFSTAHSQDLKVSKVSDNEKRQGIVKKYLYAGRSEGGIALFLFSNKKYYYTIESTVYNAFSNGQWSIRNKDLYLSRDVIDTAVPVSIKYLSKTDADENKSPFLIPVNLKGNRFPDARIFINNDTTYCFPFFDTCVGSYSVANKIKIDFGDGFKSKWMKVDIEESKRILIVAETEFLFSSYLSFKKRRYKIVGLELKHFIKG